MKFGRVENLSAVDFSLPPDPAATTRFLSTLPKRDGDPKFYLACPAWNDKGFVGKIFPPGTKQKDFLQQYSKHFNAIELNSTYYNLRLENLLRWKDTVPDSFHFCPKISRDISHFRQLNGAADQTRYFCDQVAHFESQLGPVWALLPQQFGPERLGVLEEYLRNFPPGIPFAVELRHEDWFRNQQQPHEVFNLMEDTGTVSLISDVAGRRDVLHLRITSPSVIVRFVGNRLIQSDFDRIDAWVDRLKIWFDAGLQSVYFFLHQPEEYLNADIGAHLAKRLKEVCGLEVQGPRLLPGPEAQPDLFGELF